jgi:hypothetical protein
MPVLSRNVLMEQTESDAGLIGVDADESQWRRLSGGGPRDYPPYTHTRMQEVALTLYRQNPIAFRIVTLIADYITGEGVAVSAQDLWVKKVLDEHWNHPANAWDKRLHARVRDFFLYGEMCFLSQVNPVSGAVVLSYVSPLNISDVIASPTNPEIVLAVVLKGNETTDYEDKFIKVVNVDQDPHSPTFGYRVGDALYFRMNNVSDSRRGISEIFSISEWIDGFDQFLWARIERAVHMSNWFWDITLQDATQEDVDKYLSGAQAHPPKRGGIRVHNQKVEWKPNNVKLEGEDASAEASLFRNLILGGAGMPDFFFADSGSGGRMTLAEQSEPTLKSLASRQARIRSALIDILDYQLDQAILAQKRTKKKIDRSYSLVMSKISMRNLQRSGGALSRAVDALSAGQDRNWVTESEASRIFRALVDQLGLGLDISKDIPGENPEALSP